MSRYDKYDPVSGGFRAPLSAAITGTPAGSSSGETGDVGVVQAVSLNTSGRVVVGDGGGALTDLVGVICPVRPMAVGDVIDVMTGGEIADFTETAGTAAAAGSDLYAHSDGSVDDTSTDGALIGTTVEASRAIIRVCRAAVDATA